jgi:ankyrin repeat protein
MHLSLGTDVDGWTPLDISVENGHIGMVHCLIGHGASVQARSMVTLQPIPEISHLMHRQTWPDTAAYGGKTG